MSREQKGYLFHRYQSWFVRFMDDLRQPDGTYKRKLVCKKLPVPYGGEYRTKKSVAPFVNGLLAPINSGLLNPASTQTIADLVERIYFPEFVNRQLRASTQKQYRDTWSICLKGRMGKTHLARLPHRSRRATACEHCAANESWPQFVETFEVVFIRGFQTGEKVGDSRRTESYAGCEYSQSARAGRDLQLHVG